MPYFPTSLSSFVAPVQHKVSIPLIKCGDGSHVRPNDGPTPPKKITGLPSSAEQLCQNLGSKKSYTQGCARQRKIRVSSASQSSNEEIPSFVSCPPKSLHQASPCAFCSGVVVLSPYLFVLASAPPDRTTVSPQGTRSGGIDRAARVGHRAVRSALGCRDELGRQQQGTEGGPVQYRSNIAVSRLSAVLWLGRT